jgi:hypothetical protein
MVIERIWQNIRIQDMAGIPASQALQEYVEMEDLYNKIHKDFAIYFIICTPDLTCIA